MRLGSLIAATAAFSGSVAQAQYTPARPPSLPLAVKSPYLNTWLDGGGSLPGTFPHFWT